MDGKGGSSRYGANSGNSSSSSSSGATGVASTWGHPSSLNRSAGVNQHHSNTNGNNRFPTPPPHAGVRHNNNRTTNEYSPPPPPPPSQQPHHHHHPNSVSYPINHGAPNLMTNASASSSSSSPGIYSAMPPPSQQQHGGGGGGGSLMGNPPNSTAYPPPPLNRGIQQQQPMHSMGGGGGGGGSGPMSNDSILASSSGFTPTPAVAYPLPHNRLAQQQQQQFPPLMQNSNALPPPNLMQSQPNPPLQQQQHFPPSSNPRNQHIPFQQQQHHQSTPPPSSSMQLQQQQMQQVQQRKQQQPALGLMMGGGVGPAGPAGGGGSGGSSGKMRVFTGTVKKLHDNFGFIDEDVYFQISAVKGSLPKLGDRVLVEAAYDANMPFKWNASRVQVLPSSSSSSASTTNRSMMQQPMANAWSTPPSTLEGIGGRSGNASSAASSRDGRDTRDGRRGRGREDASTASLDGGRSTSTTLSRKDEPTSSSSTRSRSRSPHRRKTETSSSSSGTKATSSSSTAAESSYRRHRSRSPRSSRRSQRTESSPTPSSTAAAVTTASEETKKPPPASKKKPPRYSVQIPKISSGTNLDGSAGPEEAGVLTVKSRYPNLYIPSDFFSAQLSWTASFDVAHSLPLMVNESLESLPPDSKALALAQASASAPLKMHVFPKDVEMPAELRKKMIKAEAKDDFSHEYSAKVMLPVWPEFRQLCVETLGRGGGDVPSGDNASETSSSSSVKHPTRCVEFLVGTRNRNELGAIGGPWSSSMDGPNPADDPQVLVNTAIRTFLSLTGIDLSPCRVWHKFVELHYYRPEEESYKGRVTPARVETVVIFVPDVWNLKISDQEWRKTVDAYAALGKAKKRVLELDEKAKAALCIVPPPANNSSSSEELTSNSSVTTTPSPGAVTAADKSATNQPQQPQQPPQPKHWSELDPKKMKMEELRSELKLRKLSDAGLKSQLISRINKAIKAEQEADDRDGEKEDMERGGKDSEEEVATANDKASSSEDSVSRSTKESGGDSSSAASSARQLRRLEREREYLEKCYVVPLESTPKLLVHPSTTAKGGKFQCSVMSLSVLLDYRQEDQKESSFEVSLFAELFNEMLLRDFGLRIYRGLSARKEKLDEEKEGEERKKKEQGVTEMEVDSSKGGDGKLPSSLPSPQTRLDAGLSISFVYFDLNRCGFIVEKDLADLLETLGLNLSRAQIRSLTSVFVGLKDEKEEEEEKEEEKKQPRIYYPTICRSKESTAAEAEVAALLAGVGNGGASAAATTSLGNLSLMRVVTERLLSVNQPPAGASAIPAKNDIDGKDGVSSSMVFFRGSMVDLEKLRTQLTESRDSSEDLMAQIAETEAKIDAVNQSQEKRRAKANEDAEDRKALEIDRDQAQAHLRMHEAKLATFSNVLQCQRDALTKGVEIIQRTLDKFEEEEENGVDHVSDHVGDGQKVLAVGKEEK